MLIEWLKCYWLTAGTKWIHMKALALSGSMHMSLFRNTREDESQTYFMVEAWAGFAPQGQLGKKKIP